MRPVAVSVRRFLVLVLFAISISGCQSAVRPKNIIFIIGDGMGIGAITSARCADCGSDGSLVLDSMPITGLVKTHSENSIVTDSAASGTALATGHKTNNGYISVDSKGKKLSTILELADSMGKSTGVLTNDLVTSATPAVFYAHVAGRDEQDDIAAQLVSSHITLAMGGGKRYFVPAGSSAEGRKDGRNLTKEAEGRGFDVVSDKQSMVASRSKRLMGLFSFDEHGPTVEEMLTKSISVLSANPKGFFVMAESCHPDKGGHANNYALNLEGVNDLEAALRSALAFARKNGETLVVVTADHETGGLAALNADGSGRKFKPGWLISNHTGNMVAVYAYGVGAERFCGTHDNTELPKIFAALWQKRLAD